MIKYSGILTIMLLGIFTIGAYGQENKSIIYEKVTALVKIDEGRCVGSSYCRVCTNCSRCGHCKSGGSCGVCSRGHMRTRYKKPSKSFTSKSNSATYNLPNDTASKYYLKTLKVKTEVLNLRKGPGTSYSIIERLKKGQKLTFLAMKGNWVKVRVNSSKAVGFVYYKYVLVLEN